MTPTKVKMKSDSDNDSLNSFKSNRSSHSDRITQLEEEFKSMKTEFKSVKSEFKAMEIGFNEKFDRILNYLDALNLSKRDDTVIIDESKNSVSTRADDPNQIIGNTNPSSQTPTKVKMKSDSDNDSLNSFKSNRSSRSDRITQLEEEFKSMKNEFNEKFDKLFKCLEALNLSKKDDTVIIDESKNSVSTRADDPNQIIGNTNPSSQILLINY